MPITKGPYAWLSKEGAPRILVEALSLFGIVETAGSASNPQIVAWAKELGKTIEQSYTDDSIPWCGLFIGVCAKRAGVPVIEGPLWARNWAKWGTAAQGGAMLGDVLVFVREGGGGHVGLYVAEDNDCYHVLGGNQADQVCITRILRSRCIAARRTPWQVAQPKNVRKIITDAKGEVSKNER